jgi:hypothetical protein
MGVQQLYRLVCDRCDITTEALDQFPGREKNYTGNVNGWASFYNDAGTKIVLCPACSKSHNEWFFRGKA